MTIRNLEYAARPRSLVVLGASSRDGSVGRVVMDNIVAAGFEGEIWPVNSKYAEVAGRRCYARAADLPGVPDLAIVVTPAETVPGLITELGEKGTRAAVVITSRTVPAFALPARTDMFLTTGPTIVRKMQTSKEVWRKIVGTINTRRKFLDVRLELARHQWAR